MEDKPTEFSLNFHGAESFGKVEIIIYGVEVQDHKKFCLEV